jgi:hypothetical protein
MSLIVAEYECPEHGRFTLTLERDANGDPPGEAACPVGLIRVCPAYRGDPCDRCGGDGEHGTVSCHEPSTWVISASGAVRVKAGEVVRGKSEDRPSDRYVMDTRPLADGMPLAEWKAQRAKVHRDESLRRVRKAFGRTGKTYVGGR